MNRTQLACYSLLASAFVLAALLLVRIEDRFTPPAHAGEVITRDAFTLLTARTEQDEESLFIIDNSTQRLLIYRTDIARKRIDLAHPAINLADLFNLAGGPGGAGGGR